MKFIVIIALFTLPLISHTTVQFTTAAVSNPSPSPKASPIIPPSPKASPIIPPSPKPSPVILPSPKPSPITPPGPTDPIFVYSAPIATTEWT